MNHPHHPHHPHHHKTTHGHPAARKPTGIRQVVNGSFAPEDFLRELVTWGNQAPADIFTPNGQNVYAVMAATLGPYRDLKHRKAVMLEVLRVLAGVESTWKWNKGIDPGTSRSKAPEKVEAGPWQVSEDSLHKRKDLQALAGRYMEIDKDSGRADPEAFQDAMKTKHMLAIEYIARLLQHTTAANGPFANQLVQKAVHRDAVAEFESLLR